MEPARPSPIRVLLVDDHQVMTDALTHLLHAEPDMTVVGVCGRVAEVSHGDHPDFDVAVMDYLLPDGNGADATRILKGRWPQAKVVFLSALDDYQTVARATSAGADAYLGKEKTGRTLVETIRATHGGTAPRLQASYRGRARAVRSGSGAGGAAADTLTARELQVLRALTHGRSTREICLELGIAPNTVRTHVQNVIGKLRVHSKTEAVAVALRDGIV